MLFFKLIIRLVKVAQKFSKENRVEILILLVVFSFIIYAFPFVFGRINQPILKGTQPLCLILNNTSPAEQIVFDFFKNEKGDFRRSFLPPGHSAYVEEKDPIGGFNHSYLLYPHAEFIGSIQNEEPFTRFMVYNLYAQNINTKYLGKLFGLANVKYILFPKYRKHYTYFSFGYLRTPRNFHELLFDPGNALEDNLASQQDLVLSDKLKKADSVRLYENSDFLPHLYFSKRLIVSSGDFSILNALTYLPNFIFKDNSLVFASDLDSEEFLKIINYADEILLHNNNYFDYILPLLKPSSIIYPAAFAKGYFSHWFSLKAWWDRNFYTAASLSLKKGIHCFDDSAIDLKIDIESQQEYKLFCLVYYGPRGSKLEFRLDGRQSAVMDTKTRTDIGFRWTELGKAKLAVGRHTLTIKPVAGYNAISAFVVVTEKQLTEAEDHLKSLIAQKDIMLLSEIEQLTDGNLERTGGGQFVKSFDYSSENKIRGDIKESRDIVFLTPESNAITAQKIGEVIYKVDFPFRSKEIIITTYPRIFNDMAKKNYLDTYYSLDGKEYQLLDEFRSNGNDKWSGIYETIRENKLNIKTEVLFLKFVLTGGSQLWSLNTGANEPMQIIAKKETLNFPSNGESFITPLRGSLYVPQTGKYGLKIRVFAKQPTEIRLRIGNSEKKVKCSATEDFYWLDLGETRLSAGHNTVEIVANQPVNLDLIYLSTGKRHITKLEMPILNSRRVNPSKYELFLEGSSGGSRLLNFSERYHKKWLLSIGNEKIRPLKGFGFSNLYIINDSQNKRMAVLEFEDQKDLDRGFLITKISWSVLIVIILLLTAFAPKRINARPR